MSEAVVKLMQDLAAMQDELQRCRQANAEYYGRAQAKDEEISRLKRERDEAVAKLYRRDGHTKLALFDPTLPPDPYPEGPESERHWRIAAAWMSREAASSPYAGLTEAPPDWLVRMSSIRLTVMFDTARDIAIQLAVEQADQDLLEAAHRLAAEQIRGTPECAAKEKREAEARKHLGSFLLRSKGLPAEDIVRMIMGGQADEAVIERFNAMARAQEIEKARAMHENDPDKNKGDDDA